MVYYRKYRTQKISDLDSIKVRETLTAVLSSKEIPHAFLFTGPKGIGKTSTARIIAKVVNCLHQDRHSGKSANVGSFEPDNLCDQCISITNGSNIDVLEIDGASNRGIDEIRDLRDKVKLAPAAAQKKVYIIDEVHMLTTEAFNALLKTIEEPPPHVMFIFCTTEPQKVPPTIISRCFHIAFSKATEKEIVHSLERIVKGENLDIDQEVLLEIAKLSDGGFRDAAKTLEEIVMKAGGKKITQELFEQSFKSAHVLSSVNNFLIALAPDKKDLKESIAIIRELSEQGVDIKLFVANLLSTLHDLLLSKLGVNDLKFGYSDKYDIQDVKELSLLLDSSYQQIKYSVLPQLPLELAILEWCKKEDSEFMVSNSANTSTDKQDLVKSSKNTINS